MNHKLWCIFDELKMALFILCRHGMWTRGDSVSLRGLSAIVPLPVNTAAAERHKDNNAPTIGGGSVHCGDVGQLCEDPRVEFY